VIIIPEPFLSGSAFMELFNVKPAENAVAELLVRGMTRMNAPAWASPSPPSEPLSALYRIPAISPSSCSLSGYLSLIYFTHSFI
jgi:hypothetical protein